MRRYCLLLLWLFAVWSVVAQAKATASETDAYKAAVTLALEEFNAGNFEEAREHFTRAHALYPNARTLRGLGMSEFELRRYVESAANLELSLASSVKPLSEELRAQTRGLLARARGYVGEVHLMLRPSTTTVQMDGVQVQPDSDGRLRLLVGDHILDFSAEGHLKERRAILVHGEQTLELAVRLTRVAGEPTQGAGALSATPEAQRDERRPVYKSWWLWTGLGVLVAGGAAAAVVIATHDPHVASPSGGSTGANVVVK